MQFRPDTDDGEDDAGWSTDDGEDDADGSTDDVADAIVLNRSWLLNPPDLGGVFVRLALVCVVSTLLSMLGMVGLLLYVSDEPFVDQPTIEDPLVGYVWLVSLAGLALSLAGYTVWSCWQLLQLQKRRSDRGETVPFGDSGRTSGTDTTDDEPSEYEPRVQKTVFALVATVITGNLPARILWNALV